MEMGQSSCQACSLGDMGLGAGTHPPLKLGSPGAEQKQCPVAPSKFFQVHAVGEGERESQLGADRAISAPRRLRSFFFIHPLSHLFVDTEHLLYPPKSRDDLNRILISRRERNQRVCCGVPGASKGQARADRSLGGVSELRSTNRS